MQHATEISAAAQRSNGGDVLLVRQHDGVPLAHLAAEDISTAGCGVEAAISHSPLSILPGL